MVSAVRDPFVPAARFELRFASARRSLFSSTVLGSALWGILLLAVAVLLPLRRPAEIQQIRPAIVLDPAPMSPTPIIDTGRPPGRAPAADRGAIRPSSDDVPLPPAEPSISWDGTWPDGPPGPDAGPAEGHGVESVPPAVVEEPAPYVDVLPFAIHRVEPEYPDMARSAGFDGVVRLEVVVDRDGAVRSARVQDPGSLFDEAALKAARAWRFRPAGVNGHPVTAKVGLTFRFTLH